MKDEITVDGVKYRRVCEKPRKYHFLKYKDDLGLIAYAKDPYYFKDDGSGYWDIRDANGKSVAWISKYAIPGLYLEGGDY